MGPAGERLSEAASSAGQQISQAASKAGERLMSVAEERGLNTQGLKEAASDVAEAFTGAFAGEQQKNPSGQSGGGSQGTGRAEFGQSSQAGKPPPALPERTTASRHPMHRRAASAADRVRGAGRTVATQRPVEARNQAILINTAIQQSLNARSLMSDPTLHQLEREVEASRAKLAGHLSVLRSPRTYSEFTSDLKSDALDAKDVLVDKAKSSVQSTIESFVDDLKARAAANPAAALAIGAGIAWRLIQRPPIATALVGAGLYSLFRTSASQDGPRTNEAYLSQAKERLAEQAGDFADGVKDRAVELGERVAEKTTEIAASVKDRAVTMGEKAAELAGAATERAQDLSEEVRSSLTQAAEDVTGLLATQPARWRSCGSPR